MMTDEDYRIRKAKGVSIRAFLPFLGLVLMIVFGVIAWVLAPIVTDILYNNGVLQSLSPELLERFDLISGGMIFMVMVLITALLYAVAAPKPKKMVTERQLDKERKARIAAEVEAKQRKKKVQAQLAQERKKTQKK
jgi:type VI protein secretion system component VasK